MVGKSARRLLLVEKQVEDSDWMVNNKGAASVCLGGIIGHLCVPSYVFLQQFPLCMCTVLYIHKPTVQTVLSFNYMHTFTVRVNIMGQSHEK